MSNNDRPWYQDRYGYTKSWVVFMIGVVVVATLLGGLITLILHSEARECEMKDRLQDVDYEWDAFGGCVGGYDNNSRIKLDG